MNDLAGTTTVVTGGAEGIGFGLVSAFAARGSRVAILDIRLDAAEAAARTVRDAGGDAVAVECDVADPLSVASAAESIAALFDAVNVLWCNAGVAAAGRLSQVRDQDLAWMFAVNVHGTLNSYRAFVPLVRAAVGTRHVGFTGSSNTLGHIGASAVGTYAATKWAVVGIAEAAAGELADEGIGATILCPGLVNTEIWDAARARPDRYGGVHRLPDAIGERWRNEGGSVDWAVAAAMSAFDEGRLYANPVEEHSERQFAARNSVVQAGFVTRPDQQSAIVEPLPTSPPLRPVRVEPITDLDALDDQQREVLASLGERGEDPANVYRTLLRYPDYLRAVLGLGSRAVRTDVLSPRLRELAILATAWRCDCRYIWDRHLDIAANHDVSRDLAVKAACDPWSVSWGGLDAAVLAAVDDLVRRNTLSDDVWERLVSEIDEAGVVDVVNLVGFYTAFARQVNTLGVRTD